MVAFLLRLAHFTFTVWRIVDMLMDVDKNMKSSGFVNSVKTIDPFVLLLSDFPRPFGMWLAKYVYHSMFLMLQRFWNVAQVANLRYKIDSAKLRKRLTRKHVLIKRSLYILIGILIVGLTAHSEYLFAADPISIVTYPLLNRPALQLPGGEFAIVCSSGAAESVWQAKLQSKYCGKDLQISASYKPDLGHWVLSAAIPKDTPFELYNLVVQSSSGEVDTVRNTVRVIPSFRDSFYFLHLPDTHLPSVNWYGFGHKLDASTVQELKQLIKEVNVINPEFILQTGDLINNGQSEEEFEIAQDVLIQSQVPIFITGGNHDLWYDGHDNWQRYFGETMDYSFDYGSTHISGMEMYNVPTVTFTAEQMSWLSRDLKTSISHGDLLRILFYHFDESRQINGNFVDDHQVDMILYGHTHRNEVNFLGSRQTINANTSYTMTDNGEYRLIKIRDGRIDSYPVLKFKRLIVDYTPSNDGTNWIVQANIDNQNPVSFDNGLLKFILPHDGAGYEVEGGELLQIVDWQNKQVVYVTVNIGANSRQIVTVKSKNPPANRPPMIATYHPHVDTSIYADQTLALRIQANDDSGPLQYSWFVDGVRIMGNDGPQLLFSPPFGYYGVTTIKVNADDGTFHADHIWEIEIRKSEGELQLITQTNNFFQQDESVVLEWLEPAPVEAYLEYGLAPGDYSLGRIHERGENRVTFIPNDVGMSIGTYYCRITDGNLSSREFTVIIESPFAPRMLNPIGPVQSLTPRFSWEPIPGIPYYLVLVSDQEIVIYEDPLTGSVNVEGANPIWTVLTAENSIPYAAPDPSGTFTNAAAPLVAGATYWWTVLNCYGDSPELTSPVQSGFSSFTMDVEPPGFDPPVQLSPDHNDTLSSPTITFSWTPVDGVNGYRLYPFKIEQESGMEVARPLWDNIIATTNPFWDYDAGNRLVTGRYRWKVAAAAENGAEALSSALEFYYNAATATVHLHTFDNFGTPNDTSDDQKLPRVQVRYSALEGINTGLPISTDLDGDRMDIVLSPGVFVFKAEKEGFAALQDTIRLNEDEIRHIHLRLFPEPSTLCGHVVDDKEINVAAARITARNSLDQDFQKTASSDHDGNFVLALSPGVWQIGAEKAGYQSGTPLDVTLSAGENSSLDAPIVLRKNKSLVNGYVVNSKGESVLNALVSLRKDMECLSQRTNGQGRFEFSVPTGTWAITTDKDGYVSPPPREVFVPADSAVLVEPGLVLTANAAIVTGTVSHGNVLLDNVEVKAVQAVGPTFTVHTDGFGQFSLNLASGNYTLKSTKPGYTALEEPQINVATGETIGSINLKLTANDCVIEGLVTGDGITPISKAVVTCGRATTITSNAGRFELSVEPGTCHVVASKEKCVTAEPIELNLGPGQKMNGINFILMPNAGVIKGKIISSLGPVAGITVTAVAARSVSIKSGEQGEYSLSLENGVWKIIAEKDGFNTVTIDSLRIGVGQTLEGVDFTLVLQIAKIIGTVTDNVGNPLRGTNIYIQDAEISTTSKSDGSYSLSVPIGNLTIIAEKSGYGKTESGLTNITSGREIAVNFQLQQRPCSVSGKIFDDNGRPVPRAKVFAVISHDSTWCLSEEDGSYSLDLLPGRYYLSTFKPGFISESENINLQLNSGESRGDIDLILSRNFALVTGMISDSSSGQAIAGARIILVASAQGNGGASMTDENGSFAITDGNGDAFLVPGKYSITAEKLGYKIGKTDNLEIVGQKETRVDLKLSKTMGEISGVVLADGNAVHEATITAIHKTSGQRHYRVSGYDGEFDFVGIPAGEYKIAASKSGYTSDVEITAVANGSVLTLNLHHNQGKIFGIVVDAETNLPVFDAVVAISDDHGQGATTSTNDSGSFEFDRLVTDYPYRLWITKPGYSDFHNENILADKSGIIKAFLGRVYGRIVGQVMNGNNSGFAGVEVTAQTVDKIIVDTTDVNGKYRFDKLAQGEYLVSVRKIGHLSVPAQHSFSLADGNEIFDVDFLMETVNVETISIDGPKDVLATESSQFSYTAFTKDGRRVLIDPEWELDKNEAVAYFNDSGKLKLNADYFGPLKLKVRDKYSGVEGCLEISAFHQLTSKNNEILLTDYAGVSLYLPPHCMERPTQVRLCYPNLPDAMRNISQYSLVGKAYEFSPLGVNLLEEATIVLPIPVKSNGEQCSMAHWQSEKLKWETLQGQRIRPDAMEVRTSKLGRFVLQSESEPLGIKDISLLPNPFSPIMGPLKIKYHLSSNRTNRPYVTIKIYNMNGDPVRTLVDDEPRSKGEQEEEWDGRTDSGNNALNGRYMIQMEAKDPGGVKKVLKTVVLIK